MSIESTNFQTRLDNMTVESLINACTGQTATRRINLDATYQRKFVWEESDQSAFIDSVCKGIIPSNIIFNKKSKEQIVIDGKQRLTSLIRYFSNEIPLIKNNEYIFFNSTEENDSYLDENKTVRIMTDEERGSQFLDRPLPICFHSFPRIL
jgi:uncharacterized protein with ParB-like and HNH nuclease domain